MLAAKAPTLRQALDRATEQGLPYLILDGTLISCDRCAGKKTSKKGKEIDKWYSGKAHEPAGNVQALAAPGGVPLWVSDVRPGSTHDLTAARELVLPGARPYLKELPILADSGYEGAGAGVLVPVKKPARGELDIDTKTRNALLRSLRYQGERGFALMSQRWRVMQRVTVSPQPNAQSDGPGRRSGEAGLRPRSGAVRRRAHQPGVLALRARTSRYRGLPSSRRPRAVRGRVVTVNPGAVRSARTVGSGQVR